MAMEGYTDVFVATLLVSLRIAPTLAFAPPFTLLRVPVLVRVFLAVWLAFWVAASNPEQTYQREFMAGGLLPVALSELLLGATFAISLQLAFAALLTVGRAIDIQVGFGLAQVADPTLRSQMPLVGTLFSYAAAAVFFGTGAMADVLAIWSHSVIAAPLGEIARTPDIAMLMNYMGAVFVLAVGIAGLVFLVLFLVDLAIAFMSRTLPQMNMLVLGFQVKTIALLVTLPFAFSFSGALFLRLVRLAIDVMPQLI
jgi:flagellar biosynthesis protein FliR